MVDHINDVETSLQRELDSLSQSSPKHCIYKVPECISKVNRECYEPSVVSIGPLHYSNPTLKLSHELKLRHLQCFLEIGSRVHNLGQYIEIIRGWEEEARAYYADKISLSSNEFIKMLMVDAAFIIVIFMWSCPGFLVNTHPIESQIELMLQVHEDLFLEENQLPVFVLHDLYDKAFGATYPLFSFMDLICTFIGLTFLPGRETVRTIGREKLREPSNVKHLVDFLRICNLPTKLRHQLIVEGQCEDEFPLTAKYLKAAGVKFVATKSSRLLDIRFSNGILEIPPLILQDTTKAIVRNIMFYEQCRHFDDSYYIDFAFFLDALIDTAEDVQILVQRGIIKHWFGSDDEVATFFNQITKQVTMRNPGFYYAQVSKDLNAYASIRWNKWKAVLRRDYFNHPWSIMSLIYLGDASYSHSVTGLYWFC